MDAIGDGTEAGGTLRSIAHTYFEPRQLIDAALANERIIKPLDRRDTYWPEDGEQRIRGSHPHGYHADEPGGRGRLTRRPLNWPISLGLWTVVPIAADRALGNPDQGARVFVEAPARLSDG